MTFSDELKNWRLNRKGDNLQKQVHEMFSVPLVTLQKWEQGVNEPSEMAMRHIRLIMAADTAGVPVRIYAQNYWRVIKQVAAEIQNRK